ncbi:MAG: four helix bundle protein [Phycisphaerales bacterium]
MGRLDDDLLGRFEAFCDRCLNVIEEMEKQGRSRRILDQLTGSATAVGANLFEADEAMSRKDFVKCMAIALKELNETRFWLRLIGRRGWITSARLENLTDEAEQLKRVLGAILTRTRANNT